MNDVASGYCCRCLHATIVEVGVAGSFDPVGARFTLALTLKFHGLQELKESFNYGLFCPPVNGKAGKFLDEERRLGDYPFNGPVGYLEVRGVPFLTPADFCRPRSEATNFGALSDDRVLSSANSLSLAARKDNARMFASESDFTKSAKASQFY